MLILNKEKAIFLYSLNSMYEIHTVKEKIRLFEKKYNNEFDKFEIEVKTGKEDFAKWDDYMEWKAYIKTLKSLLKQKEIIKNGDYQIS